MKFEYVLAAILLSTGTIVSVPTQVYANTTLDAISTNNLRQVAQEITVLVSHNQGNGSGIIIARRGKSYYVITAAHVVNFDSTYLITAPDKRQYQASILIRKLPDLDLAVLEFQSEQNYQIASLAKNELSETASLDAGGNIYISGWDKSQITNQPIFSCGVMFAGNLASLIRQDTISDGYELVYTNLTEAGLSGGPILDNQGRVIGIHGRAEGEELESIGSLKLGLSLGIPIQKFLQIVEDASIQLPLVIDKTSLVNPSVRSWSGSDPCEANVPPKPTDNAIDWANYANSLLRLGKLVDALSAYDEAIKRNVNGELYQIWYGRGLALIFLNRPNDALKTFDRALQLLNQLPADAEQQQRFDLAKTLLLQYKGLLLSVFQRYQEAITAYDEALKIKPNSYRIWILKASVLKNLNRYPEAVAAYSEAIRIEPQSLLFQARSYLYFQTGQYNLAIEDLNAAIQLNPYDAQVYALRGAMRKKLGDAKGAENDYEQVYQLTSKFSEITMMNYERILIGLAEFSVGNTKEGTQNISQGIAGLGDEGVFAMAAEIFEEMFSQPDNLTNLQSYVEIITSVVSQYGNQTNLDESAIHLMKACYYLMNTCFSLPYEMPMQISEEILTMQISEEILTSAFDEIEQSIRLSRNQDFIYMAYAIRSAFREKQGNEQGANEDLAQALRTTPNPFEVYYLRGKTRLTLRNQKGALADLQTAAQMTYDQKDMENYQQIMSIIDRLQGLPDY